jgi:AcrR family transcriptional regulator
MGTLERRRRERDLRRSRIIEAAEKVILSRGYQAATMDDVAAEAELGKGTLYLYFKNKEELTLALALRARMRMIDGFDQAIQEATNGHDLLVRFARVFCLVQEENRQLFILSFHMLAAGFQLDTTTPTYALWRESGEWSLRMVTNAIERGIRDGSVRPDVDSQSASLHILAGALGVTLVEYGHARDAGAGVPAPPSGLVGSFLEFFIEALRNPDRAPGGDESR